MTSDQNQFDLFGSPPEKKRNEVEFEPEAEPAQLNPGQLPDWATEEWFKQPNPGEPIKLTEAEIQARLDRVYPRAPVQSCAVCGKSDRKQKVLIIWLGGMVHVDCHWDYMEKHLDERAREEGWPICVVCGRGHPPVRHATLDGPIHFCCAERGEEVINVEWKAARSERSAGAMSGRGAEPDGRTGSEGEGGVGRGGIRVGEPEADGDVRPALQHAGVESTGPIGVRADRARDSDGDLEDDASSGQAEISGQGEEEQQRVTGPGPCPICKKNGGSNRVYSGRWHASVHSDCIERWLKEEYNG